MKKCYDFEKRFSIIIPVRNGRGYIQSCVESIIHQSYRDYELIISDDHSNDGTNEYLETISSHENITVITPPEPLSMTEHWEWALSHATGDWLIFVGQDDGLQPYFFELADELIAEACKQNIKVIMSERAYYFWQGCEPVYGDIAMSYFAQKKVKVHYSFVEATKALLGFHEYFELPEMYTTSLFHKSILQQAREKQRGKVLTCHPQDANLGVIACSLEKRYLKSYIPLGWVGSSPKSAGMAIGSERVPFTQDVAEELSILQNEYTEKIANSKNQYNKLAGDFRFGDTSIYFWQAFLETPSLRSERVQSILISRPFKYLLFTFTMIRYIGKNGKAELNSMLKDIIYLNNCSYSMVQLLFLCIALPVYLSRFFYLIYRVVRKIFRVIDHRKYIKILVNRSLNPLLTMADASRVINSNVEKILPIFGKG